MTLSPGARFGPYEIIGSLGVGGMGEVYRATDTKLKRQVALKVLPAALTADPDRLARFQREAEVLASLNHPNIAAIYGLEDSTETKALVMELVEGPTLAEKLEGSGLSALGQHGNGGRSERSGQGPKPRAQSLERPRGLPVDEALAIAKQMAEALEAAHEQGIIHRDLKPANIKVRPDGTVKVLDFGLAKAIEPVGRVPVTAHPGPAGPEGPAYVPVSQAPTLTTPAHLRHGYGGQGMTQAGIILGTAAYMSPEQARGADVDRRADLWAFGVVLYEMLTATRLFEGATVTDTLALVLTREPDWSRLPAATPAPIRTLLRRCLEKDRKRRLDSAAAARLEIEEAQSADASVTVSSGATAPHRSWRRAFVPLAAVAGIAAGIGAAATYLWRPPTTSSPAAEITQFEAPPPPGVVLGPPLAQHAITWSPDGQQLVYVANGTLYRRRMGEVDATPVRGIDPSSWVRGPFFSPDGRWIGFFQDQRLRRIPADGGTVVDVCEADSPFGAVWNSDDTIVYGQGGRGIWRVPAVGGEPSPLVEAKAGEVFHGPQILGDGESILFTVLPAEALEQGWDDGNIVVEALRTRERRTILRNAREARYVNSGHLLYISGNTLFGVAFDLSELTTTGTPVPLVEDVFSTNSLTGAAQFAVSPQGTLAYVRGNRNDRVVVRVNRAGIEEAQLTPEPGTYNLPRVAPDGRRAITAGSGLWILDVVNGGSSPFSLDPSYAGAAAVVWSPDSQSVSAGIGNPLRLVLKHINRAGLQTLVPADAAIGTVRNAQGFTPDGHGLVFLHSGERHSLDLSVASATGTNEIRPLLRTRFNELNADLSPDGRWIAYQSDESGRHQVYVRPFTDVDRDRWLISPGEGRVPVWSRDGRELFYLAPDNQLMAVPITVKGDAIVAGSAQRLFEARYFGGFLGGATATTGRQFDVMPDGRFLMIKTISSEGGSMRVIVVQNWTSELKRLVPVN